MLNRLWPLMMVYPLIYGIIMGKEGEMIKALLDGGNEALSAAMGMAGGFMLWCGLMEVIRQGGAMDTLGKRMRPILKRLFPHLKNGETLSAITMNLSANMLGLGNAATPMGLKAMELMARENDGKSRASHAMCMFLTLNSCCIQLLPTTVITLRTAAGSQNPGAVIIPTLISTIVSTTVGIGGCLLLGRRDTDE